MNKLYLAFTIFLFFASCLVVNASDYYTDEKLVEIILDRHNLDAKRIHDLSEQDSLLQHYSSQSDSLNTFYAHISLAVINARLDSKAMLEHILSASNIKPSQPEWLFGYLNLAEAEAYERLGKYEQSEAKLEKAISNFKTGNKKYMTWISQNKYAYAQGRSGNISKAYKIYSMAQAELDNEKSNTAALIEINLLNGLNIINLYEGRIDKAKKTIAILLPKAEKLAEGRIIHNAKGNLSQFLMEEQKYDSAILLAQNDLHFSVQDKNYSSQYGLNGIIAISYYRQNHLDSTEKYINEAKKLIRFINDRGYLKLVTNFIYDYYLETNQPKKLNDFAKLLDVVHDSLTLVSVRSNFELNRSQFELENAQTEIDQLKKINQLEIDKNEAIQRFNIILVLGIVISLTLLFVIFRYVALIRKKNHQLTEQNGRILSQNEELKSQQEDIKKQSERIMELNHLLEQKMDETAKELVIKNKKLNDYAFYNSHNVRGPLARILGLIALWEDEHLKQEEKEEMLNQIKVSSLELDEIVRELNRMLE